MPETRGRIESPFVETRSFQLPAEAVRKRNGVASPFVESFLLEHAEPRTDAREAARRVLIAELYDEELDDAIYELVGETAGLVDAGVVPALGAAAVRQRLAPLAQELEGFLQRAADELGPREAASVSESELDEVLSRVSPERFATPGFDHFFGSIKKAVKRVAAGAANLAKKGIEAATTLGLGPLLEKLKGLVRPLLERVLKAAIHRLPVALQPLATKLAGNLPALLRSELDTPGVHGEPAVDLSAIQREFDERVADLLLGEPEVEAEDEAAAWAMESSGGAPGVADLDAARQRFTGELEQLRDGDDALPAVERFIPAILPALQLGIRIVGRKRVVNLLAGLVAKLIGRFVGPSAAGALSTALVDAGMKLLSLETSEADPRRAAMGALAATVEETVRRVAALPDAVLENETLLEGLVVQAFEESAASNLPPMLPPAVYRRRPDLAETDARQGAWIQRPLHGPKRYKKFSRVFKARINPHVAMAVPTFGDAPLAQFLQEQLGVDPGEELDAEVHLYEAMPGMLLPEVARLESNGHAAAALAEFHPLTREAAGLLAGEPRLARPMHAASLDGPGKLSVGDRFFRIAVPGRRVASFTGPGGKGRLLPPSGAQTVFDFPRDEVRLYLFLGERRAQEIAATLRGEAHAGAVATTLKGYLERAAAAAATGAGRVRVIHGAVRPDESRGAALKYVPRSQLEAFAGRIGNWTLAALTDFLSAQPARFVTATEDSQDGVTVVVKLAGAPGMKGMRQALDGAAATAEPATGSAPASVQVDVVPGFTNG
jgi:hypothetical protein